MYHKAFAINEAIGRKEGMAIQYGNLGVLCKTRGELDRAEEMYHKSLKLCKDIGSPSAETVNQWLHNLREENQNDEDGENTQ